MVRFYDGRPGLLLERSDGDGAAPRLLGAGRVGAHFFGVRVPTRGCKAAPRVRGRRRRAGPAFLKPLVHQLLDAF